MIRGAEIAQELPATEILKHAKEGGLLSQCERKIQHRVQRDPNWRLQECWQHSAHATHWVNTLLAVQTHLLGL